MTSASELFYTRRSRLGRPDPEFGSDPSLDRSFHHEHHRRHRHNHCNRNESDGCDLLRRPPRLRKLGLSERRTIRNSQGTTTQSLSWDSVNGETQSVGNWGSLNVNERLPGAVLLARARLVERLRGVSLSGYRRSNRASSADQRESTSHTSSSSNDSADDISFFSDLTFQSVGPQLSQEYSNKPCGLTREALNSLHRQVYISAVVNNKTTDCSICLEAFTDGDNLVALGCSHSFHSSCLVPWLRTCGECPYCRRAIAKSD